MYLLSEFAGFSVSFSDVAQNITSATYKGVGGGLRLPFRHNGTSCCAKGAIMQWSPNHTTRQSRPSDNSHGQLEQFHTNTTLLKPAKHCHSLIGALQGHEKVVWKSRPGYL